MSPRFVKCFGVGLGALTLSCAGVQMPVVSGELGGLTQGANTLARTSEARAECEKLNTLPSDAEEYALGGAIALNWVQQGGGLIPLERNEQLVRYLNTVGKNLGAQSSRPTLKWTFGILQTEESFNAFSAPGGYVFVTLGLLKGVENEAQLAGVLAHEIAHVTQRHVLTRYTQTKVKVCKTAATTTGLAKAGQQAVGATVTPGVADTLLSLGKSGGGPVNLDRHTDVLGELTDGLVDGIDKAGFDKNDEFAADEQAVRLLVSAGYDPREYLEFLAKIPDSRNSFSNHPRKVDRVKKLVALLKDTQGSSQEFSDFSAGTEGLVQPPLPPEFASVNGSVAHDKP